MNIRVSVIMSVYNGEEYLREAIESILNQTFKDFEFIIIDDGSNDSSAEIIKSYKDPRIKLLQQENMGLAAALNRGIKEGRGAYIARMDADDVYLPERLRKQVDYLEKHSSIAALGTWVQEIDKNGAFLYETHTPIDMVYIKENFIKTGGCFYHGSLMFQKSALESVNGYRVDFSALGFNGNLRAFDRFFVEDYDLLLRLQEKYEITNIPIVCYKYRKLPNAFSSLGQRIHKDRRIIVQELAKLRKEGKPEVLSIKSCNILKKYEKLFNDPNLKVGNKKREANYYLNIGKIFIEKNFNRTKAMINLAQSVLYNPFNYTAWFNLFLCLSPKFLIYKWKRHRNENFIIQ